MKIIIFCGGKGTRLREETEYRTRQEPEIPLEEELKETIAYFQRMISSS